MEIRVELISEELIKPSSPTPHHLRKLEFSFIDHLQTLLSPPFTLFYQKSNTNITNLERSILLKKSLSKALTLFYPLAGSLSDSYADCNDEGALFIEAKANCQLSDILLNRNQYHNHRMKFIPPQPHGSKHIHGSLIQITYFNCSGLALSFAMAHKLGDALSQFIFLNNWAAVARGNTHVDIPPFGAASIFPPRNSKDSNLEQVFLTENIVTKSFVFDAFTLSAIRDKYSGKGVKLTRVKALSVFLSRIIATISRAKAGNKNRSVLFNAINLRDPPILKQSFGNFISVALVVIDNLEAMAKDDEYCREIGLKINDSIKSVNVETVKKLRNDDQWNVLKETIAEVTKGEMDKYSFSSLCHFPVYEIDFGWGNPEWVVSTTLVFDTVFVVLMDTKEGNGIEAWITMTDADMAKFEMDNQLLSHLSSNSNGYQNVTKQSKL